MLEAKLLLWLSASVDPHDDLAAEKCSRNNPMSTEYSRNDMPICTVLAHLLKVYLRFKTPSILPALGHTN